MQMAKPLSPSVERERRDQYIYDKWQTELAKEKKDRRTQTKFASDLGFKLSTVRDAVNRYELTAAAEDIAFRTEGAYSAGRYRSWVSVARALLTLGYDHRQAEAIMRSKWMRWAGDAHNGAYSELPVSAITNYLRSEGHTPKDPRVISLTDETFEETEQSA